MAKATPTTLRGILQDYWGQWDTVPAELFQDASPVWQMMRKTIDQTWSGNGTLSIGSQTGLPSAGSVSLATAFANSAPTTNTEWDITGSKFFQGMLIGFDVYEIGESGKAAYFSGKLRESKGHMARFQNIMGAYLWGDGSGALGKIATLTGSNLIITFVNKNSARLFEVGDVVEFSEDRTGGAIRANSARTVTAVSENNGTITVNSDVTTASVAPGDFVYFEDTYDEVFKGFFSWCPLTATEAATSLFGVTRSARVDRLGGRRANMKIGSDPYANLLKVITTATKAGSKIDVIATSPDTFEAISLSVRDKAIEYGNPYNSMKESARNKMMKADMVVGVDGICVRNPLTSEKVYVYGDKYLIDHASTAANDRLYCGLRMNDWRMFTGATGMGWKAYGDSTQATVDHDNEQTKEFYGIGKGQIVTANTNNNIVVGQNVVE